MSGGRGPRFNQCLIRDQLAPCLLASMPVTHYLVMRVFESQHLNEWAQAMTRRKQQLVSFELQHHARRPTCQHPHAQAQAQAQRVVLRTCALTGPTQYMRSEEPLASR